MTLNHFFVFEVKDDAEFRLDKLQVGFNVVQVVVALLAVQRVTDEYGSLAGMVEFLLKFTSLWSEVVV